MTNKSSFKGGIPIGTTAFDNHSKALDKHLKQAADVLKNDPEFNMFTFHKQFSTEMKEEYVGDNCFGFAPDGGVWFIDDKLVAAFEAKKQGKIGNASERWWDNASTAKYINPDIEYKTFCIGEGAAKGEVLDKMSRKANIIMGENFSFDMCVEGFTYAQVLRRMKKTLRTIMENNTI